MNFYYLTLDAFTLTFSFQFSSSTFKKDFSLFVKPLKQAQQRHLPQGMNQYCVYLTDSFDVQAC